MKNWKRAIGVALVLALVLGMTSFAQADDLGSLTITKYVQGRLDYGAGEPTGEEITSGLPHSDYLLGGVSFRVTQVAPLPPAEQPGAGEAGPAGSFFCADDDLWYEPVSAGHTDTVTTGLSGSAKGVAVFADMPQGIYYVEELPSPLVTDPARPFFVSIPTYLEETGEPLLDVFAYPKNENIGIDKIIDAVNAESKGVPEHKATGVAIGDTVSWKIIAGVPTDIANAQSYVIADNYSVGLQFVDVVSAVAQPGDIDLLSGSSPMMTYANVGTDGGTVTFTLNPGTDNENFIALSGQETIEIVLRTLVLDTASLNYAIPNDTVLTYQNQWFGTPDYPEGGGETTRTPEIPPKVYTGGIRVFKHDSVIEDLALEGAVFNLIRKTTSVTTTGAAAWATDSSGTVVATAISDSDGVITFTGIPYGAIDGGTGKYAPTDSEYWLVEVSAPTGYRTPSGVPMIVVIGSSSWNPATPPTALSDRVANVKGFSFPLTGGIGTMLFILAGIALAGVSYSLFKAGGKEEQKHGIYY